MSQEGNFWERFDYVLLSATMILVVFGIIVIASATQGAVDPTLANRVPDQIRYAILGVIAMFAMAAINYRILGSIHNWLYGLQIVLLFLVFIFGVEGDGGARRWLNVGILIQPSEICKILFVITLSQFFATRQTEMDRFSTIIKSLVHFGVIAAFVFFQPNLGTTIVFAVIWAVITWGAGLRFKHIAMLIGAGLIALPLLFTQLQGYQLQRITNFLFPADELEAQYGSLYNIEQSRISIGSGGLLGKGYSIGSQTAGRFLRVRHTDFIFSVIAHEWGFVGGIATMILMGVVIMRILEGARQASDMLGALICYGVATQIFFQATVAIGMNLTLLPVTGITLPLVSSGGTSLLFTMIGVGLAESVIVRRRRLASL